MDKSDLEEGAYQLLQAENYQAAIDIYQELLNDHPENFRVYCYLGLALLLQGEVMAAQEVWLSMILEAGDDNEDLSQTLLAILDQEILRQISSHNLQKASLIYAQIKEIELDSLGYDLKVSETLQAWQQEGEQLRLARQLNQAKTKYESLVQFESDSPELWQCLGLINYELFNYQTAIQCLNQAIALNPQHFIYHYNAALILEKMNLWSQAVQAYQQTLNLNPQHLDSYNNLGNLLFKLNQIESAEKVYRQAIAIHPNDYGTYINLGNLLMHRDDVQSALSIYQQAVTISHNPSIYFWVVNNIRSYNYVEEAINFAESQAHLFPNNPLVALESKRILPFVYPNSEAIDTYRHRLAEFIESLLTLNLSDSSTLQAAQDLIQRHSNYHLHYQGKNDLDLQSKYGLFAQRVMATAYPQFATLPDYTPGTKIKVGYISYCLRNHVVGKLALGWLKNHNSEQFEVYCYHLGDNRDRVTEEFAESSHSFSHYTDRDSLEIICQEIVKDKLDILVFLDLGMYPRMTQLASLRLAPIQCVTWMHPITSGIPTIDYFISGKLLEKEQSDRHYSEKLVKLPNLSICYQPRELPKLEPDRDKFQLSDRAIVYLSSQYPSKYLPQYDYLFPAIATQVKNAQFVFIHPQVHKGKNELIHQQLWTRIKKAFADYNLNSEDYCRFLPTIKKSEDYWHLFATCDLFLDTIGFTGFNSTLDAIEFHLPVVTHEGEFFRTRQSTGILNMIEVTETIAKSESEYLEIAIKLGLDQQWRNSIIRKIQENLNLLYNDLKAVRGLENFYSMRNPGLEPGSPCEH